MPNTMTACPLCGAGAPFRVYNPAPIACHDYETMPEGSRLDQCASCRFIFLNPQPTPEESLAYEAVDEQWYPTEDMTEEDRYIHTVEARRAIEFVMRVQPVKGCLLDIGSNRGFLLNAAREAGYNAYGVEPTARTAEFSRREFGVNVFNGVLEDNPYELGSFDTITLWHVLEHIPSVRPFVRKTAAMLKPDGVLFIQVPYLDYWPRPVHFNYFDCDSLMRVLAGVGLTVIAAEVEARNFLTIAATQRGRASDTGPAGLGAWDAMALQAGRQQKQLEQLEQKLAAQAAAQQAQYEELTRAVHNIYASIARRPWSRLMRVVRRVIPRS
ncbi:MAG: class I SAM-dependent methyltransferase [Armatimonadetes bacterium]|nr:class I SAM-dependent methyltransferase [Armatimonadota bacterium]